METTLTFNEEERDQALLAQHAPDAFSRLWDISAAIRNYFKHEDSSVDGAEALLERIQDLIYDDGLMSHYN